MNITLINIGFEWNNQKEQQQQRHQQKNRKKKDEKNLNTCLPKCIVSAKQESHSKFLSDVTRQTSLLELNNESRNTSKSTHQIILKNSFFFFFLIETRQSHFDIYLIKMS